MTAIILDFAQKSLSKINTIALWGNVSRNNFGYGRIPASSAAVEGEFNLVKTHILNKKSLRVDLLVENLIKQDQGRLAIFEQSSVEKPAKERCEWTTNSIVKSVKTQVKDTSSDSESSYCEETESSYGETNENLAQSSIASPAPTHVNNTESNHIEETNVQLAQSPTRVKCIVCKQMIQVKT